MSNQQYIVPVDERWDNIAFKAYGNAGKVYPIIEANPNIEIADRVPAGTVLNIPILEEEDTLPSLELLPPWKQ